MQWPPRRRVTFQIPVMDLLLGFAVTATVVFGVSIPMFLFGSGAAQPFLTYGLASFAGLFSLAGLSKLIATNRDNWRLEDLRHLCAQTAAKLPAGQAWLSDTASNTDPLAALLKRNYPSRRSILTQSDGHWNLATTIDNKTHSLWLEGRI